MARRTRSVRGRRRRRGGDPPTRAERVEALKTAPPPRRPGAPDWTFGKAFVDPTLLAQQELAESQLKTAREKKDDAYRAGYYHYIGRTTEEDAKAKAVDWPAYKAAGIPYEAAFKKWQDISEQIDAIRTGKSGLQSTIASRAVVNKAVGTPGGRRTRRRGRKGRSTRRRRA